MKKMGVEIMLKKRITSNRNPATKKIKRINLKTSPYPGFPTDLQAQIMVLMCKAKGVSKIKKIFLKIDLCMFQN